MYPITEKKVLQSLRANFVSNCKSCPLALSSGQNIIAGHAARDTNPCVTFYNMINSTLLLL